MVKVVIPVYKELLDKNEIRSFKQCLKVLNKHPIVLVCSYKLNLIEYEEISKGYNVDLKVERFDVSFFNSIQGYNKLMLSKEFYLRFYESMYILIYQLDAWVFRDELIYWCKKDYDYIGAPWFEERGSYEEGMKLSDEVGNGGFSLRKVQFFLKALNWRYPVLSPKGVICRFREHHNLLKTFIAFPKLLLQILGYKNTIKYYSLKRKPLINEDFFWSFFKSNTWIRSKIPDACLAMKFSIERSPSYLFKVSENELPFGCHGWDKYGEDFWKLYIKNE